MSEPSECLQLLLNRSQRMQPWRPLENVEASEFQMDLLDRIAARRWAEREEIEMRFTIIELADHIAFIEHARNCERCLVELQLDVERYLGTRALWYLNLSNEEFYAEDPRFTDWVKAENYRIGSYWTGCSDDTIRFIKDRLNWAEERYKKQLGAAMEYLKILETGDFNEIEEAYHKYLEGHPDSFFFWGVRMEKEQRVFKIRGREHYLSKDEVQKEFGCSPRDIEEIWKDGRRTRLELCRQMRVHGKTDPWELTEFDQWVNHATRKDIENLLAENSNVFGLKFWSWVRIPPEKLKEICNFGVDLIFREKDRNQVEQLINDHQQDKEQHGWSMKKDKVLTEKLFDLAILDCTWV